jgi:hypothetical protein
MVSSPRAKREPYENATVGSGFARWPPQRIFELHRVEASQRRVAQHLLAGLHQLAAAIPNDQRVRLVQPTAAGAEMLARFSTVLQELMHRYFVDWTPDELVRLLRKMLG